MSGFQELRDLFRRRLLAAVLRDEAGETTTSAYEEELHRQRKLQEVILTPEIKLRRADVQQLSSLSLGVKDTKIKQEQEKLSISQEGEQLEGLSEDETSKFFFNILCVKKEEDEEMPPISNLCDTQTTEDCGRAEPGRKSDLERRLRPGPEVKTENISEPETEDSDDYTDFSDQSGLRSKGNGKHEGDLFKKRNRITQVIIDTDQNPFSGSACGERFTTLKMAKRHAYEAQFKLQATSYAEQHGNRAAAREFNINESMVRKWRKLEHELRQVKKTQLRFRGHKARWPELEERLEQWITEQTSAFEEELHRQRELQEVILTPEIKLRRADVQQLSSLSLDVKDTKIKQEQEKLSISQEGEQLEGLSEDETSKFFLNILCVKKEEDEEMPPISNLCDTQTTEDCGRAEPGRKSDLERRLQPGPEVKTENISEPETEDSDDYTDFSDQSGLRSKGKGKHEGDLFKKHNRITQVIIDTDQNPFSGSACGEDLQPLKWQRDTLMKHSLNCRPPATRSNTEIEPPRENLISMNPWFASGGSWNTSSDR